MTDEDYADVLALLALAQVESPQHSLEQAAKDTDPYVKANEIEFMF